MKERITGAVVLVVFVVLVVPVFLDGPPEEGEIVSERVTLPGQDAREVQTRVLERDRDDPMPAAANGDGGRAEPPDEVIVQPLVERTAVVSSPETSPETRTPPRDPDPRPPSDPDPQPEPVVVATAAPAAKPTAASSTGMWAVQLGSFGNRQNAERLAADLRKQGFAAFLSQLPTDNGPLHRVRIGPQKDRESAEAMAERLQKAGHRGQVLPHP